MNKIDVKNKLNQLMNIGEKHTRTERHLEQNSDISSPESIKHEKEVQDRREEEIDNLKNNIVYGDGANKNEMENLKDNYEGSQEYLESNKDHMTKEDLNNLKKRQENRADRMNGLQ